MCDGYEAIGRAIGLVTDSAADMQEALFLRHFSDRITLFVVSSGVRYSDDQQRQLADAGVVVVHEPVAGIRLWDSRVTVRHGDAETTCDALYGALGLDVHSGLAATLGARRDAQGYLRTDAHQQTSRPADQHRRGSMPSAMSPRV